VIDRLFLCFWIVIVAASTNSIAFADVAPAVGPTSNQQALLNEYQSIVAATQEPKPDAASLSRRLEALRDDPGFASLAEDVRHGVILILAAAYSDQQKSADALATAKIATGFPQAGENDWRIRIVSAIGQHDDGDVALGLTQLALHWPTGLSKFRSQWILSTAFILKGRPESAERLDALAKALFDTGWSPDDPFLSADDMWANLAISLLAKGDTATAIAVGNHIVSATTLAKMRVDKRFDPVTSASPAHFDIAAAQARNIDDARRNALVFPSKLEGANRVANALYLSGQADAALKVVNDALAQPTGSDGKSPFADYDEQINWAFDVQARALSVLGREDESVAALAKGAKAKENGAINVSQAINLADAYNVYANPKAALEAIAGVTDATVSRYGRMALEDAKACAFSQLDDSRNMRTSIEYLKTHTDEGVAPYIDALQCIGDRDALARELIAQMDNAITRSGALMFVQDYLPSDKLPPRAKAEIELMREVRSRPDVQAEIAKVGRVESIPLTTTLF
jgi:hypothetical protein